MLNYILLIFNIYYFIIKLTKKLQYYLRYNNILVAKINIYFKIIIKNLEKVISIIVINNIINLTQILT